MAIRTTILRRASVLGDYKFEGSFAHRGGGPLRTGGKGGRASITQVPNCLLVFRTAGGWAGQRKVGWGVGGGLDYKKKSCCAGQFAPTAFCLQRAGGNPFPSLLYRHVPHFLLLLSFPRPPRHVPPLSPCLAAASGRRHFF